MDDKNKQLIMQGMAALLLQWCDGVEVSAITVHADVDEGMPYMKCIAWGPDPDADDPVWVWADFPEKEAE